MYILFGILVIVVALLLALVVIIQNPKGGMLSSSIGTVGNQILGAGRSTDAVEKITWYLAGGLMLLCIASVFLIPDAKTFQKEESQGSAIEKALKENKILPSAPSMTAPAAPAQTAPGQAAPANGQGAINTNSTANPPANSSAPTPADKKK
jgi:preprotein translocase subunit SecG